MPHPRAFGGSTLVSGCFPKEFQPAIYFYSVSTLSSFPGRPHPELAAVCSSFSIPWPFSLSHKKEKKTSQPPAWLVETIRLGYHTGVRGGRGFWCDKSWNSSLRIQAPRGSRAAERVFALLVFLCLVSFKPLRSITDFISHKERRNSMKGTRQINCSL